MRVALSILFISIFNLLSAQSFEEFQIEVEEISISNMPGLQSFVTAQHEGKWLFIGGRQDGLHQRQPNSSFLSADNNKNAYVIDVQNDEVYSASLSSLSTSLYEQLQSTNMEFEQVGSRLCIIGGYGYSNTSADHITYPNLTAVDVPGLISAIISESSINGYFRQIEDERFRVTGGYLGNLNGTFYLAGGQNFEGRYNPMGPTHGPGFFQEYTNAISSFNINDDGTNFSISNYAQWIDSNDLHRRDYNMSAQVFADGTKGFTMFSGVFQHNVDLPWLNTVDFDANGYQVRPNFNQHLNQYHTAHMSVFDAQNNTMHTAFFGGISRYTLDSNDQLVDDPDVPFVKTISLVTRLANDTMQESQIGEMNGFLGSGAEFIPLQSTNYFDEMNILKLNDLPNEKTLVGHIVGGIESTADNIFFVNTGSQSDASTRVFEVYIMKGTTSTIDPIDGEEFFATNLYPNPANQAAALTLSAPYESRISIAIYNLQGAKVLEPFAGNARKLNLTLDLSELSSGTYQVVINNEIQKKAIGLTIQ
ncbi:MAG: T9SS type A sorting domain-containing protein [Flavobacteriales bacterium]